MRNTSYRKKDAQGLLAQIGTLLMLIGINYLFVVGVVVVVQLVWSLGASSWLVALPVYLVLGLFGKLPTSKLNK